MRLINLKFFFLCTIMCAGRGICFSQRENDSSFVAASTKFLIQQYHQASGKASNLYNGKQYEVYPYKFLASHQFFLEDGFVNGSVSYDGVDYENVRLKLDIIREELLLQYYDSMILIHLHKELIDSFRIGVHNFIRIKDNILSPIRPGYYEVLYNGKTRLLVKHAKTKSDIIENRLIYHDVTAKDFYYVFQRGQFYPVKNKKEFFKLFADKGNALRQCLRQSKINFKHNKESALKTIVAHYDQLTN